MILLLTTFEGIEQHVAQGANLIFFIPTSIAAITVNLKNKNIEKKIAIIVIIAGIVGAIIGARIAVNLDVLKLKKYFGIFLLLIAVNEIHQMYKQYLKPYINRILETKKANNKNI